MDSGKILDDEILQRYGVRITSKMTKYVLGLSAIDREERRLHGVKGTEDEERLLEKIPESFHLKSWATMSMPIVGRSDWQIAYGIRYNVDTSRLNRVLEDIMNSCSLSEDRKRFYRNRWYHGCFDFVTEHFFVMDDILVPTMAKVIETLNGSGPGKFFVNTLGQQKEFVPEGCLRILPDVTVKSAIQAKWGPDREYKAVRALLFGSKCWVVDGILHGPSFELPVQSCPVQECIWSHWQSFSVMFPYGLPIISSREYTFLPHDWLYLNAAINLDHGLLVLTDHGERCCRAFPLIRTDFSKSTLYLPDGVQGVWETMMTNGKVTYIRPCPDRPPDDLRTIGFRATPRDLVLPLTLYRVDKKTTGPFTGYVVADGGDLLIDSGYRIEHNIYVCVSSVLEPKLSISQPINLHGVWHHQFTEGRVISPVRHSNFVRCRTGVKCCFYSQSSPTQFFIFKDGENEWDMVGGRIEWMETPLMTLLREFKEEVGVELRHKPTQLGVTSSTEDGVTYSTFVFVCPLSNRVLARAPSKWKIYDPDEPGVSWMPRHYAFILERMKGGNYEDLWLKRDCKIGGNKHVTVLQSETGVRVELSRGSKKTKAKGLSSSEIVFSSSSRNGVSKLTEEEKHGLAKMIYENFLLSQKLNVTHHAVAESKGAFPVDMIQTKIDVRTGMNLYCRVERTKQDDIDVEVMVTMLQLLAEQQRRCAEKRNDRDEIPDYVSNNSVSRVLDDVLAPVEEVLELMGGPSG